MELCLRCASYNVESIEYMKGIKPGRKGKWYKCHECGHTFLWDEPTPDSKDYVPQITTNYEVPVTSPSGLTIEEDTEDVS